MDISKKQTVSSPISTHLIRYSVIYLLNNHDAINYMIY